MAGVSQSLIAKLEAGTIDSSYTKVKTIFDVIERLEAKTKIQERKVVPNQIISIQKDEPVLKVVKLMKEHGYSQIPVFNGKQSVGSISEKTILREILAGKDLDQISNLPIERHYGGSFPSSCGRCTLISDFQLITNISSSFGCKKREMLKA